ncbi:MAG: endonuclease V, partial [Alcanivorax sp.]
MTTRGSAEVISAEELRRQWADMDARRARRIQDDTAARVCLSKNLPPVTTVAGVDVGFEDRDTARAAIVVLDYRTLEPLDYALARLPVAFPYVPGL